MTGLTRHPTDTIMGTYADDIKNANEQQKSATKTALDQYQQQQAKIGEQANKAGEDYITGMNAANQASEQAYQQNINSIASDLNTAQKEQQAYTSAENTKSIFGAATEFANALTNMFYVNRGASNQQSVNYSHDWMKQADQNRRERKQRIDNIRERQRAAEQQLAQLKAGNMAQLAQNRYNIAQDGIARQNEAAKNELNAATTMAGLEAQGAKEVAQARETGRRQDQADRKQQASEDLAWAKMGYKRNAKGEYEYDPVLAANISSVKASSDSGSGNKTNFVIPAYPDGGYDKDVILQLNTTALNNALLGGVKVIDDLPPAMQDEYDLVKMKALAGTVKADELKKFIPYSPKLRELVREVADGTLPEQPGWTAPASSFRNSNPAIGDDGLPIAGDYVQLP